MNENTRLIEWMERKSFDTETLAKALGLSYSSIYMQTRGGRPVSAETKWRFAVCFGMDEAQKIFDTEELVQAA